MKYEMPAEGHAHCLECGDPIPYGRSDRKYCSDRCRNRWHNREYRRWRRRFAGIIDTLLQNHLILDRLLKMGVDSVPKTELAQLGFRIDCVPSCRKVGRHMECGCFDIRYRETEGRIVHLERGGIPLEPEGV